MTPIPPKLRKEIDQDSFYKTCCLYGQKDHVCGGRITMEHSIIFASKQVQEKWAIIPVCAKSQDVDEYQDSHSMVKQMNIWVALNRATDADLTKISKAINYHREKARLNKLYGPWVHVKAPGVENPTYTPPTSTKGTKSPFKTLWYPVSESDKNMIDFIVDFFVDHSGIHMSQFEVIKKCIEVQHRAIKSASESVEFVESLKTHKQKNNESK